MTSSAISLPPIATEDVASAHSASRFYRPELDILRAVAFLLVFLCHTSASIGGEMHAQGGLQAFLADVTSAGAYGVDLFFLLSAYLISELFRRELTRDKTINIPAFYLRRILRIWPLYYAFTLTMLALSYFTPVQFPGSAIAPMMLFYSNWYFVGHAAFSPGLILWSVSVEEQFYIGIPLLFKYISRRFFIFISLFLIVLSTTVRYFVLFHSDPHDWRQHVWFNTFTRLDPIAAGILIALLLDGKTPSLRKRTRITLLVLGLVSLYAAHTLEVIDPPSVAGVMFAYPIAAAAAASIFFGFLGAKISWRVPVFLGRISYGLYVFHLFSLDLAKIVLVRLTGECSFWERGLIALPITILLAGISYRWLEKPFLRLKKSDDGKQFFPAVRNWLTAST